MQDNNIGPADLECAEDLDKLPVLTKDILRTHSKQLMAKEVSEMSVTWTKTGGTTGEPMQICKNMESDAWASMCYERGLKWGGLEVDAPRITLFGGSLGIDKTSFATRIGELLRGDVLVPAFELRADTAASYFSQIRRSRCHFVLGYPSAIYRLAVLAEEMAQDIVFEAVFPTAELLLPEWEEVIRRVFKCAVLPYYGCGEINALGFCRLETDGYLIPEEHALIEVMRDDGSTHLHGQGTFIITDLDNYAMPILRYINGDAGKISPANGQFPFSRIERLDGRYNSFLMTETGDLISGVIGTHVFRHFSSVKSYQIIQEEPLEIVIRIVPKPNFTKENQNLIENLFRKHLGRRMKITIEEVCSLPIPPSGKSVFVINHCLENPSSSHPFNH